MKKWRKVLAGIASAVMAAGMAAGVAGTQVQAKVIPQQVIYRLYNPWSGEHLYTTGEGERDVCIANGWMDEGYGWVGAQVGDPVYRLYNPNGSVKYNIGTTENPVYLYDMVGDHYYTTSKAEGEHLVELGWQWDNNGDPLFYSNGDTPLYVCYNPNADSGAHHYTTDAGEKDQLLKIGWDEGNVAWYVMGTREDAETADFPVCEPVDEDITGDGGSEDLTNTGSYRLQYATTSKGLAFDEFDASGKTPLCEFSADLTLTPEDTSLYETQFVIGGNGDAGGQIGIELRYMATADATLYGGGKLTAMTIDFPSYGDSYGDQFYAVYNESDAPTLSAGTAASVDLKYFSEGYMQAYVDDVLVGQYKTSLQTNDGNYILHDLATNCTVQMDNIKVQVNGEDVTSNLLAGTNFGAGSCTVSNGSAVSAAYAVE